MKKKTLPLLSLGALIVGTSVGTYHLGQKKGEPLPQSTSEASAKKPQPKSHSVAAADGQNNLVHPPGCGCALHRPTEEQLVKAVEPEALPSLVFTKEKRESVLATSKGKAIQIALPNGETAQGVVEFAQSKGGKPIAVSGKLTRPTKGEFYFHQEHTATGEGEYSGAVHFDESEVAFLVQTGANGEVKLQQTSVHQVVCRGYADEVAASPEGGDAEVEQITEEHPTDIYIPEYQNGVIPLQSLPGATAVAYLDFDGEKGPFLSWGDFDALPAGTSTANTKDIWSRVAEDFAPFNVNVTTDLAVYLAAPQSSRVHCIVTPTTDAYPGAGGVAYIGDFNRAIERPCWAFHTTTNKTTAEKISHEIGHTMKLGHDGRIDPEQGYYLGHGGSGDTSWASIMGAGYYRNLSQWSRGEYHSANNTEDDLAIIAGNNNVGYRTDDHGATLATASALEVSGSNQVNNQGIIETSADEDGFKFTATASSALNLSIDPINTGPNLDILAELVDSAGAVVASSNGDTEIDATIATTVAAGDYFVRVSGVGRGTPTTGGYSDYGSLGQYTITGTVTNTVQPDRFSIAENAVNSATVGTVTANNNHGSDTVAYAISSGNASGAFAINSSGVITVADASQLNYESLTTGYEVPAEFDLSVTITNSTTPSLTETVRVVVTVTDVNEAPVFSVSSDSLTKAETNRIGELVWTASVTEVDLYDGVTFTIPSGNEDGVFAINGAGELTLAKELDFESDQQHVLTIVATDTSALSDSLTLTINVTDEAEAVFTTNDTLALSPSAGSSAGNVLNNDNPNGTQAASVVGLLKSALRYDAGVSGVTPSPTTQGWTELEREADGDVSDGNSTAVGSDDHNDSGLNAWVVSDNTSSTGFVTYTAEPTTAEIASGQANGWLLESKMRFVDDFNGTKSTVLIYGTGGRRYVVFFNLNVNGDLFLELVGAGGGSYAVTAGGSGTERFHDVVLGYDHVRGTVWLAVDGVRYDSGDWTGQAHTFTGVQFGNGSTGGKGSAAFHRVEWSALQSQIVLDSGADFSVQSNDVVFNQNGAYAGLGSASPVNASVRYAASNGSGVYGIGSLNVTVTGDLPEFTQDAILGADVVASVGYAGSIASYGVDNDDAETFSKVSGPAWLNVAADGTLSGTPDLSDAGENTFTVAVHDGKGNSDQATLTVHVVGFGLLLNEGFESYDVENPSDFSESGVPSGKWVASNTASDAQRIFDTVNYGSTRLWISNVDGASITSAGIPLASHGRYGFSAAIVAETANATSSANAEYDLLVGQTAATAVSLIGGPQSVVAYGDEVQTDDSKADQTFTHNFQTGALNEGDKLFVRITRVSGGSWLGVDDVQISLSGANTLPVVAAATFSTAENTAAGSPVGTVSATDADAGDAIVSYAITAGNSAGHFAINSSTGAITTTAVALDYEVATSHALTVSATDRSAQAGSATITVNVTNVMSNDDGDADDLNDDWEKLHYTSTGNVAPTTDTDGDGLTAFEEMVFGTDPNSATGQEEIVTLDEVEDEGVKMMEVRFRRPQNHAALGVNYTLRSSANLTNWVTESVTATAVTADADGTSEWVSYRFPMAGAEPRFYEMRAVSAE